MSLEPIKMLETTSMPATTFEYAWATQGQTIIEGLWKSKEKYQFLRVHKHSKCQKLEE